MEKWKKFYLDYRHSMPLLVYGVIYLSWFCYLEKKVTHDFTVIYMAIDDYIPFAEVFIIPYLLWFIYVIAVVLFLFFKDKGDYYKVCIFLFTGMTIFLIVSTLWPNGQHLRPFVMPRDNIFTRMVTSLYHTDTPTNLWPSIHVYNSLGAHIAIARSKESRNRKALRAVSLVLCISIILSTMLLKQHSVFDVLTAFGMAVVMYGLVYRRDLIQSARQLVRPKDKSRPQIE